MAIKSEPNILVKSQYHFHDQRGLFTKNDQFEFSKNRNLAKSSTLEPNWTP
jgi:hypothetical protein